ncbi:MAG: MBL fold metallo-hydrolase [Candidatus Aenigmatarchaeota archaeon]
MYAVKVLKPGYSKWLGPNRQQADGTVSLVKGDRNIIVDTGSPWDRDFIVEALRNEGLSPEDINYVVCTHGHSDHIGNLNLFRNAIHIVSYDIAEKDVYTFHPFASGIPFKIDLEVQVIPTPGHGSEDISVIVRTKDGIVAIVGDLFESIDDLGNDEIWKAFSKFPEKQRQSREFILKVADFIVPGHGHMFRNLRASESSRA